MTKSSITDNLTANFKSVNKRTQQPKPSKTITSAKAKSNQTILPFTAKGGSTPRLKSTSPQKKTMAESSQEFTTHETSDMLVDTSDDTTTSGDTDASGQMSDGSSSSSTCQTKNAHTSSTIVPGKQTYILTPEDRVAAEAAKAANKLRRAAILEEIQRDQQESSKKPPSTTATNFTSETETLTMNHQDSLQHTPNIITPNPNKGTGITATNPYAKASSFSTLAKQPSQQRQSPSATATPQQINNSTPSNLHTQPFTSATFTPSAPNHSSGIRLKNQQQRQHIHRFDLRLKIASSNSEDASQKLIQKALVLFFSVILQADATAIIPPYLKLDREANGINDISGRHTVADIKGFINLKRYFSNMYPKPDGGFIYCRVILATSCPFDSLISKVRPSLMQYELGLWQRPTDCEQVSDIGWLLYSSRHQDEQRLATLLSTLIGEPIGVRWRPVRTTSTFQRNMPTPVNVVRALHLEGDSTRAHILKHKLACYYDSKSTQFPDGTRMRLIPPFNKVISAYSKSKYGEVVSRQAKFTERLASQSTWEFSSNLILDRLHPRLNKSIRDVLLAIESSKFPGTSLFHTIDKGWGTESNITFTFVPENEEEGRMYITGLVPFIRDTADAWFLRFFTEDAISRYADAAWDPATNQLACTSDVWINGSLTLDGHLNGEPNNPDSQVLLNMPLANPSAAVPPVLRDGDSISTFQTRGESSHIPRPPTNNTLTPATTPPSANNPSLEIIQGSSLPTMGSISPLDAGPNRPPAMGSITLANNDPDMSRLSDAESRFSAIESHMQTMSVGFNSAVQALQQQTNILQQQATTQHENQAALTKLLQSLLRDRSISVSANPVAEDTASGQLPANSSQANTLPGLNEVGDPSGIAGNGY